MWRLLGYNFSLSNINTLADILEQIFNYLQVNGASNYNYKLLENEITELKNNGIIDKIFKITNIIEEVLNFPEDDVDITSKTMTSVA